MRNRKTIYVLLQVAIYPARKAVANAVLFLGGHNEIESADRQAPDMSRCTKVYIIYLIRRFPFFLLRKSNTRLPQSLRERFVLKAKCRTVKKERFLAGDSPFFVAVELVTAAKHLKGGCAVGPWDVWRVCPIDYLVFG
jgi:hypothetical protein